MAKQIYTALTHIASVTQKKGFVYDRHRCDLPRLLVFTDPQRSLDLQVLAQIIPAHSALVYRHFGADNRFQMAQDLAKICRSRGVFFLIGADPDLALQTGADGVHMPQSALNHLSTITKSKNFRWVTSAAHSKNTAQAALQAGAHAAVVSCVFSSNSPSANSSMGLRAFSALAKTVSGPVFALGGINSQTIKKLHGVCHGVALVSATRPDNTSTDSFLLKT